MITNSTVFVQGPDYIGFRKTPLPVQALGAVYDSCDPYATPLGVIFLASENNYAREIYVRRGTHTESGCVAYTHDLDAARYVMRRNGFEEAQLCVGEEPISDEVKNLLRSFLELQNTEEMSGKYVVRVCG